MKYNIPKTKGRPRKMFKIRSIKGMTPKDFTFHKIKKNKIIFKRKETKEQ